MHTVQNVSELKRSPWYIKVSTTYEFATNWLNCFVVGSHRNPSRTDTVGVNARPEEVTKAVAVL